MRRSFLLALFATFLAGCGSLQVNGLEKYTQLSYYEKHGNSSVSIKNKLYEQFKEWQGVRYQFGGLSKRGIDCSGFVYMTYKSILGINLPRTTQLQSKLGVAVSKNNLKTGDLVFFKTSRLSRHVGIYLEKNTFLHASQSKGVIISRLDNTYWASNYWKSIRI